MMTFKQPVKMAGLLLVSVISALLHVTSAERSFYMDSPSTCSQKISVADEEIILKPRGPAQVSNPPTECVVIFESSYQDSSYAFEIIMEAATFDRGCDMSLIVYDGPSVGAQMIQTLGCGSPSTLNMYSKDNSVTFRLKRTRNIYVFGSDFSIRIKTFRAPGAGTFYTGIQRLSAGAIIGIVFGVIVLIAVAILLGWCYKTGRLGYNDDSHPGRSYKSSKENIASAERGVKGEDRRGTDNNFVSWNMKNEDKMSMSGASRSNFDLNNSQVWESLMGSRASITGKKEPIKVDPPRVRALGVNRNGNSAGNYERDATIPSGRSYRGNRTETTFERFDNKQLSHSPGSRTRGRQNTTASDSNLADEHEYYNLPSKRSERERSKSEGRDLNALSKGNKSLFENPDAEGYLYDYDQVQTLSSNDVPKDSSSKPDFKSELEKAIQRKSMKRSESADAPGAPSSTSELEKIDFEGDITEVPSYKVDTNPESEGPAAQSSPKTKKKRKRKSKKSKEDTNTGSLDTSNEDNAPKSPRKKKDDENVPPEVFAPIFTEEDSNPQQQNYYPSNQYQPGHQGGYPMPYDPRYPQTGMYPFQPGMPGIPPNAQYPYQQAGQAQWYVENTPTGGQQMAFAMKTHTESLDSDDVPHPGMPGYSSTPHNTKPRGQHKYKNALVPAGTILDDPQVPPPGTSLVRYDNDPLTGVKTSQVVWTDAKADPTDPDPNSACQVTRKTITRVTTKATHDSLPDAPNPSLQDMSFGTAQHLQATGEEPSFMSPSKGAPIAYPPSAIQYNVGSPDRSNSAFYTNQGHKGQRIPGSPAPAVIHQAPNRNNAFKDKITMSSTEDYSNA